MKQRLTKEEKISHGIGAFTDNGQQVPIPHSKQQAGSLRGLFPVVIDSRTVVYRKPSQSEAEVKLKYAERRIL